MTTQHMAAVTVLLAAAVVPVANADIISVPGDQPTIQAGINAAADGDEVVVAVGEYLELINFNGKAITVRSTDPTDAGVVLNTIINGGGAGTVVTCEGGEGSNTVLWGFVITGGSAFIGGGMANDTSSPTIVGCTFSGNVSDFIGGGMANINSSPTVTDCTFSGNTANLVGGAGGGMYNNCSSPTVTNCTFIGNSATVGGGGGMFNLASSPTVTNCTFSGNSASFRGGGMYSSGSSPTVANCTFTRNSATDDGGGMFNGESSSTVINCTFSENSAGSSDGGGIRNRGGSPTVTNTGFCDNTPDQISGIYTDGGGNSLLYCPPPLRSCPADIDNDGMVGITDFLLLLSQWGPCP